MRLMNEKVNQEQFFSVGFDPISHCYLLAQTITYMGYYNRFFKITKKEADWFENAPDRLVALAHECLKQNTAHAHFFFSEVSIKNTIDQNEILSFYEQADRKENKEQVLSDKILVLLREIEKAQASIFGFDQAYLNHCRIEHENALSQLKTKTLPPSKGSKLGSLTYILKSEVLSSMKELVRAADEVDCYYRDECQTW